MLLKIHRPESLLAGELPVTFPVACFPGGSEPLYTGCGYGVEPYFMAPGGLAIKNKTKSS
jgi:hypothetical protein